MSPSPGNGSPALRRKLLVTAAALAAVLLPTGCDLALPEVQAEALAPPVFAEEGAHPGHSGSAPVVVPVGNSTDTDTGEQQGGEQQGGEQQGEEQQGDGQQGEEQQGDGQQGDEQQAPTEAPEEDGGDQPAEQVNGLDLLGRDCSNSDLEIHDGFQAAPRCIETAFGEVSAAEQGPQLLITGAPETVGVDEEFQLTVSTRNLVRDRFLGAAAGGYYLERSFLDDDGLQRGHFHSACRMLSGTDEAPEPARSDFFLATQDNGGGAAPDQVTITVPGLPAEGEAQCAIWAGDGSHRIPMMELVDQIPAFDTVRMTVG